METITPTYIAKALEYFFTKHEGFGFLNPEEIIKTEETGPMLFDALPLIKLGYADRNAIQKLFFIYIFVNGLYDEDHGMIKSDDHMMQSFDSIISAAKIRVENKYILMDDAVKMGIIDQPITTYDACKMIIPNFDPARFQSAFRLYIILLNVYTKDEMTDEQIEIIDNLENISLPSDPSINFLDQMITEKKIIENMVHNLLQLSDENFHQYRNILIQYTEPLTKYAGKIL